MVPRRLLLFAVGVELLEIGEQVAGLLLILQSSVDHLGAGYFRLGILDVLAECCLVPGQAGLLVGGRIVVAGHAAGLAADETVENRTDAILGGFADLMAALADAKHLLPRSGVLGPDLARACNCQQRHEYKSSH